MNIIPNTSDDIDFATELSQKLHLKQSQDDSVVMVASVGNCFLRRLTPPVLDWHIDFASNDYQQAFVARGRKKDPLARALGLHKKPDLYILDMTAGLGKDALWMAHCGATVAMVERHPALAYLLQQAIDRLKSDPPYQAIAERMTVANKSAQDYLVKAHHFDVAYYDPMFEPRKKSALVKKDMQLLQALHGDEVPEPALILLAKQYGLKVVVKRAKADPPLLPNPHHSISTTVTRFDVY